MVLRCYSQGVEEDKDHHYPVKALGLHIHKALHPEEAIPATGQAAEHKDNPAVILTLRCRHVHKPVTH